jgi:cytochrome bd-type quinol oxidase subunit 2
MDALDSTLMAARAQFAITISFHIVLAALTLGLANFLMVLEALWLWRGRRIYLDVYRYWLKIFALNVAVGTASGLILEYQFGLNWSRLSTQAGDILGPLMFYEVPLFSALGIFILAFALMIAAMYPLVVPPNLTLKAASSSPNSQIFMLIGFAVLIPVTLIYNTYGFKVFSGKVHAVRD